MSISLSSALKELKENWSQKEAKRASGGNTALSGFDYQFALYIEKIVNKWVELDQESKKDPKKINEFVDELASSEALSDITERKAKIVVCSQVKRTLTSASIKKTLAEFASIYSVALETKSSLTSKIEFHILFLKKGIDNEESSLRQYLERLEGLSDDQKIELEKKIKFTQKEHPEQRLISLLINNVHARRPYGLYHKWLGRIISASQSGEYDSLANLIWEDLFEVSQDYATNPNNFIYWNKSISPPREIKSGDILTGQMPTIEHFREGYFFERTKVYTRLFDKLCLELNDYARKPSGKIKVFWVSGRSGSGKSICFLYLMDYIYKNLGLEILFCENHSYRLKDCIDFLLENKTNKQYIFSFDDPFLPGSAEYVYSAWSEQFSKLLMSSRQGNVETLPMIFACGPTEHGKSFEKRFYSSVDVSFLELGPLGKEENADLVDWFQKRTGKEVPKDLTIEDNVLLVQLLFILSQNEKSLDDFAIKFKERLCMIGERAFTRLAEVLSMNLLYTPFSADLVEEGLTYEEKVGLKSLENELHFGLDEGRGGYWFLHPHLSYVLFNTWFKENESIAHNEYTKSAILKSLEFASKVSEKVAGIWALINRLDDNGEAPLLVDDRISEQDTREILEEVLKVISEKVKSEGASFLYLVPCMVSLNSTLKHYNVLIIEKTLELLRSSTPTEVKGYRMVCHKLISSLDDYPQYIQSKIQEELLCILEQCTDWHEWPFVFSHFLSLNIHRDRLFKLYKSTFADGFNCGESTFGLYVLDRKSLQVWGDNLEYIKLVRSELESKEQRLLKVSILESLAEENEEKLRDVFLSTLSSASREDSLYLLEALMDKQYEVYYDLSLSWLKKYVSNKDSTHLIERLVKGCNKRNEELEKVCLEYLKLNSEEASFLVENMLKKEAFNGVNEVRDYLEEWLISNPDAKGWRFALKQYILTYTDERAFELVKSIFESDDFKPTDKADSLVLALKRFRDTKKQKCLRFIGLDLLGSSEEIHVKPLSELWLDLVEWKRREISNECPRVITEKLMELNEFPHGAHRFISKYYKYIGTDDFIDKCFREWLRSFGHSSNSLNSVLSHLEVAGCLSNFNKEIEELLLQYQKDATDEFWYILIKYTLANDGACNQRLSAKILDSLANQKANKAIHKFFHVLNKEYHFKLVKKILNSRRFNVSLRFFVADNCIEYRELFIDNIANIFKSPNIAPSKWATYWIKYNGKVRSSEMIYVAIKWLHNTNYYEPKWVTVFSAIRQDIRIDSRLYNLGLKFILTSRDIRKKHFTSLLGFFAKNKSIHPYLRDYLNKNPVSWKSTYIRKIL